MAFTHDDRKEITCKILYLGPKNAGKTSNLRSVLNNTAHEIKQGLFELDETNPKLPFFDFLPLSFGMVKDYHVKLHLYAFSLQMPFEVLRRILFTGVDGFVFVADSQILMMAENLETMALTQTAFKEEGYIWGELPQVVQFNKRDEKNVTPLAIMSRELNVFKVPEIEAVASRSQGTLETLRLLTRQIFNKLVPT